MNTNEKFATDQENFWAGEFGLEYISRNKSAKLLASNLCFFSKSLNVCDKLDTVIEFGANVGMNLKALRLLYPDIKIDAIEINEVASKVLSEEISDITIFNKSILEFKPERKYDLVLIKGVLIHLNPDMLNLVYEKLFQSTGKYMLVCEYYNPSPVSISYRGHSDRLFKRDFAGEILDRFPELVLIDYGFAYHRDQKFPQDDINWFLLKKK